LGLRLRLEKKERSLSIIGAGRLGTALGLALGRRGWTIDLVVSRNQAGARGAVKILGTGEPLGFDEVKYYPASTLILITTPDDEIEATSERLSALAPGEHGRGIVLHTSGALSSDVLNSLRDAGAAVGSMHPLLSVSDPVTGADELSQAWFCVEGDGAAEELAVSIVELLGARSFRVESSEKALYHAAAVMSAGHVVALLDVAIAMLGRCGLTAEDAIKVIVPLVQSAVRNVESKGTAEALTGSFARADVETIKRHLAALQNAGIEDALRVYSTLGARSLELAKARGVEDEKLKRIRDLISPADD
jgi:predicted short-subunit dehydrogenase-like oxidoreductase (DUF2520 family)